MSRKYSNFIAFFAVVVLVSLTVGIASAAPVTQSITYQGKLTDAAGNPLTGAYTVTFNLYEVSAGGTAIATDTHSVTATKGLFATQITADPSFFDGRALWLGIKVGADTEMTPRQEIRPVPYALSLRPGALVKGSSSNYAMYIVSNDASNSNGLKVDTLGFASRGIVASSSGDNSDAIYAETTGASSATVYAVARGPNSNAVSVETHGDSNSGVWSDIYGDNSNGFATATHGSNSQGVNVVTTGTNSKGVFAQTSGDNSNALFGSTSGSSSYGVYGIASGNDNCGVSGGTTGSGSPGVFGSTTGPKSPGVSASTAGSNSHGVVTSTAGWASEGVHVSTTNQWSHGVYASTEGANSEGVYASTAGSNSHGVLVQTSGPSSFGVFASTAGTGSAGVLAQTSGPSSDGVYASTEGTGSPGVYVNTGGTDSEGVVASTTGQYSDGVYAYTTGYGSAAVAGRAHGLYSQGVYAYSEQANAIDADTAKTNHQWGVYTDDYIYAGGIRAPDVDVAEFMPVLGDVTPGTVLVIGPEGKLQVSTIANDTRVAGIISTSPAIELGTKPEGNSGEAIVAVAGRVPCKVDATKVPIHAGDLLTTSDNSGYAMKATNPQIGTVLGKSMGTLESGTGTIEVLVTLQ